MIHLFLICVYIQGDILTTYYMNIFFKREKILSIRSIDFQSHACMWFVVCGSQNECTPRGYNAL
jgi:hypothetical protein